MAKPILLTVDDELHVLNAIERDLRTRYAEDYRVLKASSGAEALELVASMRTGNIWMAWSHHGVHGI
ncbi:MAG: hypothetical protein P8X64_06925, partial [Anaerolineales bacterium]